MSTPNIHLNDPLLAPFLSPTFSPIAYLNSTLPTFSHNPAPSPSAAPKSPSSTITQSSLANLTSTTQSQISTLAARTTTLSETLTALTDDILRCSSRLAYEVELLRGEAVALVESLTLTDEDDGSGKSLNSAIRRFAPRGLSVLQKGIGPAGALENVPEREMEKQGIGKGEDNAQEEDEKQKEGKEAQEAIERLRTLQHVKSQLQATTQTFSAALSFPLPPSLLSGPASSLITVNPPDTDPKAEEKGQAALSNLRREIADLLALDEGSRGSGLELEGLRRARERAEELRRLVGVWKGTAEEKARAKVVGELEGMVEEATEKRRKGMVSKGGTGERNVRPAAKVHEPEGRSASGSRGFLGGLQRLRDEIYME